MYLALLFLLVPISQSAEAAAIPVPPGTANQVPVPPGSPAPLDDMLKLRDPFKKPDSDASKAEPKGELELIAIDSLKMVGVLTGPNRMRAMLAGPDGKSYLVRSGMKIGTRNGVILRITSEKVLVREKIVNVLGQEENVDSDIPLQSDKKGKVNVTRASK